MKRPRNLICGCCGSGALGRQWYNQDTGYGLCHVCSPRIQPVERQLSYGTPGVHYAMPLSTKAANSNIVSWTENGELLCGVLKSIDGNIAIINTEVGVKRVRLS